jgi:hypothetical protein
LLDGTLAGTTDVTYKIDAGTDWEDAIRAVLLDAGEIKPAIIEPITATVAYTILVQPSGNYADILTQLCNIVSYVYYFDNEGFPRFESPTNIETASSVFTFTTNENIYLGSRKRYEYSKVKNSCSCFGSNINGQIFKGLAEDTNSTSSTRIALIGKRALVITDENIYSDALAQTRAEFELAKAIQVVESISSEAIPVDSINPDDVITLIDPASGTNDRYLIQSIGFPLLNTSSMQIQIWNARSLL